MASTPYKPTARMFLAWIVGVATAWSTLAASAAPPSAYAHYKVIKHPGAISLIYYYSETNSPVTAPSMVAVDGERFVVDFGVKPPTVNSVFLLEHSKVQPGETVLDMGTGTGLHAIFAAKAGAHVIATDIDSFAIENAKRNASAHQLGEKIDFRVGDLFGALKNDERVDVVFLNLAYPFDEKTQDRWALHERFFADVGRHLQPNGRIYYQIGFIDNIPPVQKMLAKNQLQIMRMDMARAVEVEREPIMMMIQRIADTAR